MKRLALTLAVVPAMAFAQDTTARDTAAGMQFSDAVMNVINADRAVSCGLRDDKWARGVNAMMLAQAGTALKVLDKDGNTRADDIHQWWILANNMTISWNIAPAGCQNLAEDTSMMALLDELSEQGNTGD